MVSKRVMRQSIDELQDELVMMCERLDATERALDYERETVTIAVPMMEAQIEEMKELLAKAWVHLGCDPNPESLSNEIAREIGEAFAKWMLEGPWKE